ncbi:Na+/H+ antiporter [Pseudoflavitalea sp. G-6-1-2]|uniref:Na+/H+ antiporter n=1 Tax=Pseudoflavitalea sp. G-6-1-2 TaxID=2728841 RepID=UPI00146AD2BF|nr:Na+/H+ antiporter [Pseudoflavitalea sp. G-6-1-2]NML19927.1 Na+/H+ antiporter [Pseudoflavitalea sp. G-6-1-2]
MLQNHVLLILSLLFVVSMLAMLSEKLRISYPIFLVIAGLLISFIPGIPEISLEPEVVFIIFLPPLLYSAAWYTSWNDFWTNRRPIGLLSIGLVIFTSAAVAFTAVAMIPGFTLAMGFLLGGIIAPPDAVAATSVLQGLKVPKRVITILEGESLVNDASSLIVFRFALATIMSGQFILWKAGAQFVWVSLMGIAIGLAIAFIEYLIHRFLPTNASIDTAITLITPYLMYITAEHFHFSGVLAVVAGGLFMSSKSHEIFSYNTRIQTTSVWNTLVFLLNGVVFIMIGLQLPGIVAGLEENTMMQSFKYAVVISVVTILIRILWVYPATYLPRVLSKKIKTKEPRPGWRPVFLVAWSGMRGVVSLAAALSIPLALGNGHSFPFRNLILFITFCVILVTLVIQGLSLPFLLKALKIEVSEDEHAQEQEIRLRLANAALSHMETNYAAEANSIEAFIRLKDRYKRMAEIAAGKLEKEEELRKRPEFLHKYREMLVELVHARRMELNKMRHEKQYADELLRKREDELDLEEARLRK